MQVMDDATLATFLWRLTTATEEEKVKWSSLGDSQFSFVALVGRFAYIIKSRDQDDVAPFGFSIHRTSNGEPAEVSTWSTEGSPALTDPMSALYSVVKTRTLGLHTIVAEMFEDLSMFDGGPGAPDSRGDQPGIAGN